MHRKETMFFSIELGYISLFGQSKNFFSITELRNWRELLETTVKTIEDDVSCLKNEKSLTEHDIRVLEDHLNVLNECFTIRDLRRKPEATHDDVEVQLKQVT